MFSFVCVGVPLQVGVEDHSIQFRCVLCVGAARTRPETHNARHSSLDTAPWAQPTQANGPIHRCKRRANQYKHSSHHSSLIRPSLSRRSVHLSVDGKGNERELFPGTKYKGQQASINPPSHPISSFPSRVQIVRCRVQCVLFLRSFPRVNARARTPESRTATLSDIIIALSLTRSGLPSGLISGRFPQNEGSVEVPAAGAVVLRLDNSVSLREGPPSRALAGHLAPLCFASAAVVGVCGCGAPLLLTLHSLTSQSRSSTPAAVVDYDGETGSIQRSHRAPSGAVFCEGEGRARGAGGGGRRQRRKGGRVAGRSSCGGGGGGGDTGGPTTRRKEWRGW